MAKEKLETHPQLGVYQLAAMAERFEKIPELLDGPQIGGAKLIEVGADTKDITSQQGSMQFDEELREAFEASMQEITEGMVMSDHKLKAKVSEHCTGKYSYGSCKLHLIEQVSYGR